MKNDGSPYLMQSVSIEMAIVAKLKDVPILVFERGSQSRTYQQISSFGEGKTTKNKPVRVLYGGRVHYDALEVSK